MRTICGEQGRAHVPSCPLGAIPTICPQVVGGHSPALEAGGCADVGAQVGVVEGGEQQDAVGAFLQGNWASFLLPQELLGPAPGRGHLSRGTRGVAMPWATGGRGAPCPHPGGGREGGWGALPGVSDDFTGQHQQLVHSGCWRLRPDLGPLCFCSTQSSAWAGALPALLFLPVGPQCRVPIVPHC